MDWRTNEEREAEVLTLFDDAMMGMRHEFVLMLSKVGVEGTSANPDKEPHDVFVMLGDALHKVIGADAPARRQWLALAAIALGHVVSNDFKTGHTSPALPI